MPNVSEIISNILNVGAETAVGAATRGQSVVEKMRMREQERQQQGQQLSQTIAQLAGAGDVAGIEKLKPEAIKMGIAPGFVGGQAELAGQAAEAKRRRLDIIESITRTNPALGNTLRLVEASGNKEMVGLILESYKGGMQRSIDELKLQSQRYKTEGEKTKAEYGIKEKKLSIEEKKLGVEKAGVELKKAREKSEKDTEDEKAEKPPFTFKDVAKRVDAVRKGLAENKIDTTQAEAAITSLRQDIVDSSLPTEQQLSLYPFEVPEFEAKRSILGYGYRERKSTSYAIGIDAAMKRLFPTKDSYDIAVSLLEKGGLRSAIQFGINAGITDPDVAKALIEQLAPFTGGK